MKYVIVGGGISGTSCAARIKQLCPDAECVLISPDAEVQHVSRITNLSSRVEDLHVDRTDAVELAKLHGYTVRHGSVARLHPATKKIELTDGSLIAYDRVCMCTGARPKQLLDSELVHHIRDHHSVQALASQLASARRVMVVGNGGIALELVSALPGKDVIWAMKHEHAGDAFFDIDAASFLLTAMQEARDHHGNPDLANAASGSFLAASDSFLARSSLESSDAGPSGTLQDIVDVRDLHLAISAGSNMSGQCTLNAFEGQSGETSTAWECASPSIVMCQGRRVGGYFGHAVGPTWTESLAPSSPSSGPPSGALTGCAGDLCLEYGTRVLSVEPVPGSDMLDPNTKQFPIRACLDNGHSYDVDMVVAAIGVQPNTDLCPPGVVLAPDGGILIDRTMCSSIPDLYAAGDCCSIGFEGECPQWFQMRLWSQARTMGLYAAHCMAGKADALMCGFNFEMFTHVTRFMGKKVVLLGLYNGQKLEKQKDSDIVTYARATEGPNSHFVRVLLLRGKMQGAILIGDTDLEETFEQLILDQLDLSAFGPGLLDPSVDLEHLFD